MGRNVINVRIEFKYILSDVYVLENTKAKKTTTEISNETETVHVTIMMIIIGVAFITMHNFAIFLSLFIFVVVYCSCIKVYHK